MKFEGRDRQDTSRYFSSTIYTKLDELTLELLKEKKKVVYKKTKNFVRILGSSVCVMQWTGVIRDGTLI
jgi:hypothetical protein